MKDVIIIGAGSVGGHIAANPELYNLQERIIGFLDDDLNKIGTYLFDYPIIADTNWILDKSNISVIIGIAFPTLKQKIYNQIFNKETLHFPTLVSNRAWVSNFCKIGKGSI